MTNSFLDFEVEKMVRALTFEMSALWCCGALISVANGREIETVGKEIGVWRSADLKCDREVRRFRVRVSFICFPIDGSTQREFSNRSKTAATLKPANLSPGLMITRFPFGRVSTIPMLMHCVLGGFRLRRWRVRMLTLSSAVTLTR